MSILCRSHNQCVPGGGYCVLILHKKIIKVKFNKSLHNLDTLIRLFEMTNVDM